MNQDLMVFILEITNLDEYSDIATHWVPLYVQNDNNTVIYFNSFGVEHIPKETKTFIKKKNIKTNIFRIQAYDSIVCGYFYIGFIDFILARKTDYANLFWQINNRKMIIWSLIILWTIFKKWMILMQHQIYTQI